MKNKIKLHDLRLDPKLFKIRRLLSEKCPLIIKRDDKNNQQK